MKLFQIIVVRIVFFFSLFLFSNELWSKEYIPVTLREVKVSENVGAKVELELPFIDSYGKNVVLKDFFTENRPVILNLAYYTCPMLCHLVSTGLSNAINALPQSMEGKFDVVTISINPNDDLAAAAGFRNKYLDAVSINKKGKKQNVNWRFLLGKDLVIDQLTDTLGFSFRYNEKTKQFAHSAVLFVLTPDGVVSRYLYGIEYPVFDFKMALLEAADHKTVNSIEKLLLFCYNYDPQSKKYVVYSMRLMRVCGILTFCILLTCIIYLKLRENKGK